MTNENNAIEQLWYTWSSVGIDTIRAGFRIRAASEGLQDFRSELVQRLDPYQRYSLPRDADRSIDPKIAPICLAFIDTGEERILVQKTYTGRDDFGRYGVFFVHLLVLPEFFSVTDAISLWKSPFWQNSDAALTNRRSTSLERVSLTQLIQPANLKPQTKKRSIDQQTEKDLCYVVQAYLTKNLKTTTPQAPQKLYIAGPDDVVAQLISGLIHCLPAQLVKDLTFSTYEHDVTEATTEIVGTCWLSVPKQEKVPTAAYLLPPHYYQEKLALNCYTGDRFPLEDHDLAAQCAQSAVEYFLTGTGEFQEVLDDVASDDYLDLTVERFLQLFETIVVNAQQPVSQSQIEDALMARTLSGYNISARVLSRKDAPSILFSLILNVPGWWATHKNDLINLRRQSTRVPKLAQALTKIAREALPFAIDMVKNEKNSILVDVIRCAAPPQEEPSVWDDLLHKLPKTKQTLDFLQNHWSIHAELMKIWSIAVPPSKDNNKLIAPFLTISWAEFGEFLTLDLPFDWVETATQALVFRAKELGFPPPDQEMVHYLEQKYHQNIQKLLEQLSQNPNPQRSLTVTAFFDTLVKNGYQKKMSLLSIPLNSPMGNDKNTARGLLQTVQLAPDEKARFLVDYGPRYLPEFTVVLLDLFSELASSDLQKEKMPVLFSWLDSPHISPWFDSPQMGEENLAKVLNKASLNTNQIGEFFQRYGQKYIPLYPGSSTLLSLFDSYASNGGRLRLSILNIWYKCDLQSDLLIRVLKAAHLTSAEMSKYHSDMKNRLGKLSQDPRHWPTAMALFGTLITGTYQKKMSLLSVLLDSPMGKDERTAKELLQTAQLAPVEKAQFLVDYGPRYLPNKKLTEDLLNMFAELESQNLQKEKMRVLSSWLDSPDLSPWFDPLQKGEEHLATVLTKASLNVKQIGEFFQRSGQKYIPLYPGSPILLSLFDNCAHSIRNQTELRLFLLNIWLKCNLLENTLTRILSAAHLTSGEKVSFLQHYGKHYLLRYSHSRLLKDYVQEFLNYLRTANVTIFKGVPTPEKPSLTEEFLSFLSTLSPPYVEQIPIYHWYNVAQFVRQPSLLRKEKEGEPIAQSIKYLLVNIREVQSPMRTGLIRELAVACIANENEVKLVIDRMYNILVLQDRVQLFYNIAESVKDGIHQRKYAKTLYIPCIQSALAFHHQQAMQDSFVNDFLNTLLQNVDKRTLKWLDTEATHWPADISAAWRKYRSQRSSSSTNATSLLRPIKPFWEHITAFIQMHKVPQNNVNSSGISQPAGNSLDTLPTQQLGGLIRSPRIAISTTRPVSKNRPRIPRKTFLFLSSIVVIVIILSGFVYLKTTSTVTASTVVTLTVTTQNYDHPVTLSLSDTNLLGTVPATLTTKTFTKTASELATGTTMQGISNATGTVNFTNTGTAGVKIPNRTIVATSNGIRFETTGEVLILPQSTILVPIQATNKGVTGNVPAGSITVIPPDSLTSIAQVQSPPITEENLTTTLKVNNPDATARGEAHKVTAVAQKDLDNAKNDLLQQVQPDIDAWTQQLPQNGLVGQLASQEQINPPADTPAAPDKTFSASIKVTISALVASPDKAQGIALNQLDDAVHADQKFGSTYAIIGAITLDLAQQKVGDGNTVTVTAIGKVGPKLDIAELKNSIKDKAISDALTLLRQKNPAIEQVDIQTQPDNFSRVASSVDHIIVRLQPAKWRRDK